MEKNGFTLKRQVADLVIVNNNKKKKKKKKRDDNIRYSLVLKLMNL